jgi:hypothetical protein
MQERSKLAALLTANRFSVFSIDDCPDFDTGCNSEKWFYSVSKDGEILYVSAPHDSANYAIAECQLLLTELKSMRNFIARFGA